MGKSYGIEICRNALVYLSSGRDLSNRVFKALSELSVMKVKDDLSQENYDTIIDLSKREQEQRLGDCGSRKSLIDISREVVFLCAEIIEENSKEIANQDSLKKRVALKLSY